MEGTSCCGAAMEDPCGVRCTLAATSVHFVPQFTASPCNTASSAMRTARYDSHILKSVSRIFVTYAVLVFPFPDIRTFIRTYELFLKVTRYCQTVPSFTGRWLELAVGAAP